MNKSTENITTTPRKMYRIAGIRIRNDHYLVDTSGFEVERTNSPESFIKALEIARNDIAKGLLPRSYRETDRKLPCGTSEPRVYWSPVSNSISCRFIIDSLNISDGYGIKIKGEPTMENKEYVDGLEAVVKERDRMNKELVIPALLTIYDERIEMFKDITLGKAVEVMDNITNIDGIPLPPGISRNVRSFEVNISSEHRSVLVSSGGSELELFLEACEIAAELTEKGLYPYREKARVSKLPCGTAEKSITHKKVKDGHQFIVFYNRTQMNKPYRRTFAYTGKVSIHNPNYRDALRKAVACRDRREKYIAGSYHKLYRQTAIAILERIRKHGPGEVMSKRYAFRADDYGIKDGDKQILGIPLIAGLSLFKTLGIRIANLTHRHYVRFLDYPHPLYALKAACEKLLESYQRHGIGRYKHEPSILAMPLPHGKAEKYISLKENVNTYSLRVAVNVHGLGFSYARSFKFNGIGGTDNPDYMLKLGQAIRARDKAVDKINELAYSELRSTIRAVNLKIDALETNEGVEKMDTKGQLPLPGNFEEGLTDSDIEGLTDSDIVELWEDLNSTFTEAMKRAKASSETGEVRSETKPIYSLDRVKPTNPDTVTSTGGFTETMETEHKGVGTARLKHHDGPSSDSNVLVRVDSDGIIIGIDTNKKAKIEIFDTSADVRKLVSMTLIDLSTAKSHSIKGDYNGKSHEIQFTVNGRQLTLHSVHISEELEFILTEE